MSIMVVDAKAGAPHIDLDIAGGAYQSGDVAYAALADVPGVDVAGAGGIALAPDGRLIPFAAGAARLADGIGLLLEPASRNRLAQYNAAPTSTAGWGFGATPGATLTLVDDGAALYAAQDAVSGAYLFRDLIDAGIMNGKVLRGYNPSATDYFFVRTTSVTGSTEPHSISAYVRCGAGSGDIRMLASATGPTFSNTGWARTIKAGITPSDAARQFVVGIAPGSIVYWILACLEPGLSVTSPIVVTGVARDRAADRLALSGPYLGRPHVAVVEATIARNDGVNRRLFTLSNGAGLEASVRRTQDNALSASATGAEYVPRIPRCYGPGHVRAGLRIRPWGRTLGFGGALAHEEFLSVGDLERPAHLPRVRTAPMKRLTIGADDAGGEPLTGWIRRVFVQPELDDDDFRAATAPPAGSVDLDIFRYIDPDGDDGASGKTPATAWATPANTDAETLPNGSHVLLKRGAVWNAQLLPKSYCTYGAYGSGARPQVGGGVPIGIDENSAVAFRIENMSVKGSTLRGFNQNGFGGTMLWKSEFSYCGVVSDPNALGLGFRNARDFYMGLCHVHHMAGGAGDDVFLQAVQGLVRIEGCLFETPDGHDADCFQISQSTAAFVAEPAHVIISGGCKMDMRTTASGSGKGCLVLTCGSALVEDFDITGLNFGVSNDGPNQIVRRGVIREATQNSYSWGAGISGRTAVENILYEDLLIEDCNRGLISSGNAGAPATGPARRDIVARRITVRRCPTGLLIDRPTSGQFQFITFEDCATPIVKSPAVTVPAGGTLTISLNTVVR